MHKISHAQVDNVLDGLDASLFRILQHAALGKAINSAADLANAIGVVPDRVAKTVLVGDRGRPPERRMAERIGSYAAVCLPSPRKINVSALAQTVHWPGCQLATRIELVKVLGFEPGTASPLLVGEVPLVVDESLLAFGTIFVGSGAIGIEVEIDPRDLVMVTKARVANIAIE
jgi:Cys-tRNA(Pro)/Cys-tRNA(Cys) deacylase